MSNVNPKQSKKKQKPTKANQNQPSDDQLQQQNTDDKQSKKYQKPPEVIVVQPRRTPSTYNSRSHEKITMIERIPYTKYLCLAFDLRCGTIFIGITGIIFGSVSFLAYLILIDRSELDLITVTLLLLLAMQALVSILFIAGSVLLVIAASCDNPGFIPAYIWITIIYWSVEMLLGIFIPFVLFLEGSLFKGLIWSCLVMILSLVWTHYLAVVKSYMWDLYAEGAAA